MIESSLKQAGRDADSDPGDWPPAAAADHIGTHDRIRRADRDGLTIALATTDSSARAAGHEPGRPAVLVRFSTAANGRFRVPYGGTPTGAASRGASPASVPGVEFSRELRNDVLAGDITLSVRLWKRPQVKQGGPVRSRSTPSSLSRSRRSLERTSDERASPIARRCASAPRTPGRSMRTRWSI